MKRPADISPSAFEERVVSQAGSRFCHESELVCDLRSGKIIAMAETPFFKQTAEPL